MYITFRFRLFFLYTLRYVIIERYFEYRMLIT